MTTKPTQHTPPCRYCPTTEGVRAMKTTSTMTYCPACLQSERDCRCVQWCEECGCLTNHRRHPKDGASTSAEGEEKS